MAIEDQKWLKESENIENGITSWLNYFANVLFYAIVFLKGFRLISTYSFSDDIKYTCLGCHVSIRNKQSSQTG